MPKPLFDLEVRGGLATFLTMGYILVANPAILAAAGSWQTAMGLVVLDGLLVLALVVLGLREAVMQAIPRDLRRAIGVGIGLFICADRRGECPPGGGSPGPSPTASATAS